MKLSIYDPDLTTALASQCAPTEEETVHTSVRFRAGATATYYIQALLHADTAYGQYTLRVRAQ